MKTSLLPLALSLSLFACTGVVDEQEVAWSDGSELESGGDMTVNGSRLSAAEARNVTWLARNVAGHVPVEQLAAVTWWSLKEGILSLDNPHAWNLCSRSDGDVRIGALEVCGENKAWQTGIAATQVPNWSLEQVRGFMRNAYGAQADEQAIVRASAERAQAPLASILQSNTLRKAYLLRDGRVGTLATYGSLDPCLSGWTGWCGGNWDTAVQYGNSSDSMRRAIRDLTAIFAAQSAAPATPGKDAADEAAQGTGVIYTDDDLDANVRSQPNTSSAIVTVLAAGTRITVQCARQGESIDGNSRWDYLPEYGGFVADALVRGAGSVATCR